MRRDTHTSGFENPSRFFYSLISVLRSVLVSPLNNSNESNPPNTHCSPRLALGSVAGSGKTTGRSLYCTQRQTPKSRSYDHSHLTLAYCAAVER